MYLLIINSVTLKLTRLVKGRCSLKVILGLSVLFIVVVLSVILHQWAASPGNLLERQIFGHHPRLTEAKLWNQQSMLKQTLPPILMYTKVCEPLF